MNDDRKKGKRVVIIFLLICFGIAALCFGIAASMIIKVRQTGISGEHAADIAKIVVFIGIFFLVMAFGYLVPILRSLNRNKAQAEIGTAVGNNSADPSEIFDEGNMRRALEPYIPDGETLLAGIHAIAKESMFTGIFGNCVCLEDRFVPAPEGEGGVYSLNKKKYNGYDVYMGVTQNFLVITQCNTNRYYYQVENITGTAETLGYFEKRKITGTGEDGENAKHDSKRDGMRDDKNDGRVHVSDGVFEVREELPFTDIGNCFPLSDIQKSEIKSGMMGSIQCFVTMKNGSYFKLLLPLLGGAGGGMPHHKEYREAVIAALQKN